MKVSYTPTNILQNSDYYPFGLQTANSWTRDNTGNNFLYDAGNELNTTSGFYDLPFRNYDAALGRFFQVDPLAVYSHGLTPYHYANNNPINLNDPSGLMVPLSSTYFSDSQMDALYRSSMGYMSYDNSDAWTADYTASAGYDGTGGTWKYTPAKYAKGTSGYNWQTLGDAWYQRGAMISPESWAFVPDPLFDSYVEQSRAGSSSGGLSGNGAPVIFVAFDGSPRGFDKGAYMSALTAKLIANGFAAGTQVMEYSLTNRAKAWWNNSPTGTISMTSLSGDMPVEAGGWSNLNNPNSIVVYWGLNGLATTGAGGTIDGYVDASLHEIGHAFFGFDHDGMGNGLGISGSAPTVMDYRYAYSGIGFNAQELKVVGSSIYSGH